MFLKSFPIIAMSTSAAGTAACGTVAVSDQAGRDLQGVASEKDYLHTGVFLKGHLRRDACGVWPAFPGSDASAAPSSCPVGSQGGFKCLKPLVPQWFGETATTSLTCLSGLAHTSFVCLHRGWKRNKLLHLKQRDRFTSVFCSPRLLLVLLLGNFARHIAFISISCRYHLIGGVSLVGD